MFCVAKAYSNGSAKRCVIYLALPLRLAENTTPWIRHLGARRNNGAVACRLRAADGSNPQRLKFKTLISRLGNSAFAAVLVVSGHHALICDDVTIAVFAATAPELSVGELAKRMKQAERATELT
jgi:hypothetical protein